MKPQPEEVLKLAAKIIELKRDLSQLQASWDALFPDADGSQAAKDKRSRAKDGSGVSKIVTLLTESPDIDFEPLQISNVLGIPLGTTRTSLSKLVQRDILEKRGAAKYGAKRTEESVAA